MTKRLMCFFASLFMGFFMSTSAFAQDVLRVGVDANLKPFVYMDSDGGIKGFDVDVAKKVCERIDRQCVFVPMGWDSLIPALNSGKIDAVISSMSITEEREKVVDFTTPYYKSPSQMMIRAGDSLQSAGDRVGVLRGSTDEAYAKAELDVQVISYGNQNEAMLDLTAGRIKAVLGPKLELQYGLIDTPQGKGFELTGPLISDERYYGPGIGMAVKEGRPELLQALNDSIIAMKTSKEGESLSRRYFGFNLWAN